MADFGLAQLVGVDEYVRTSTYGTVTHMPPELLREGKVSQAVDVYSFGVLLWSMMAGTRPWVGLGHLGVIEKVVEERCALRWPEHTPPSMRMLGTACLAYEAAGRPSFVEVLAVLAALVEEAAVAQSGG